MNKVGVIPTHEQIKIIKKYGLRYDDVRIGPDDGEIIVKDTWQLEHTKVSKVIGREGELKAIYKFDYQTC